MCSKPINGTDELVDAGKFEADKGETRNSRCLQCCIRVTLEAYRRSSVRRVWYFVSRLGVEAERSKQILNWMSKRRCERTVDWSFEAETTRPILEYSKALDYSQPCVYRFRLMTATSEDLTHTLDPAMLKDLRLRRSVSDVVCR